MRNEERIQQYMTLCPHSIGLDQDLERARRMMRNFGIHHLPVQSGGELVGIVSDRDIKFTEEQSKDKRSNWNISDVYTPEPYVVEPETPLATVLNTMVEKQIGCALVCAGPKLIGIFTTTDACRVLRDCLSQSAAAKQEEAQ